MSGSDCDGMEGGVPKRGGVGLGRQCGRHKHAGQAASGCQEEGRACPPVPAIQRGTYCWADRGLVNIRGPKPQRNTPLFIPTEEGDLRWSPGVRASWL